MLGGVEKGTNAASTRVESIEMVERLSLELERSLQFVMISFTGMDKETMTEGVNAHKQWT